MRSNEEMRVVLRKCFVFADREQKGVHAGRFNLPSLSLSCADPLCMSDGDIDGFADSMSLSPKDT